MSLPTWQGRNHNQIINQDQLGPEDGSGWVPPKMSLPTWQAHNHNQIINQTHQLGPEDGSGWVPPQDELADLARS